MVAIKRIVFAGTLLMSLAMESRAQPCEKQWVSMGTLNGADGHVYAMTRWDPDGIGPEEEILVVGGAFDAIGEVVATGVAAWDGTKWRAMGGGIPLAPNLLQTDVEIYALAVFEGELIAAGEFHASSGSPSNAIARWDGESWRSLGNGFEHDAQIRALTVFQGRLIAGGKFRLVGGQASNSLAQWDGAQWSPVPGGVLAPNTGQGSVFALEVYDDRLIVGGEFGWAGPLVVKNIVSWDGQEWFALLDGLIRTVTSLQARDGMLFASGQLFDPGTTGISHIAMWDGTSWRGLQNGAFGRIVNAMADTEYGLAVAGDFVAGPVGEHKGVAFWDGSKWLGTGATFQSAQAVEALRDELFAGGADMLRWNGQEWDALTPGTDNRIRLVTSYRGNLVVAGDFWEIQGVKARRMAIQDGETWAPLGNGANHRPLFAMCEFEGDLIAGGTPGSINESSVSRWDGQTWEAMGAGSRRTVRSLIVYDGRLFAAGFFLSVKGKLEGGLVEWTGSRWRNAAQNSGVWISALAVHNGDLYGAGDFVPDGIDEARVAVLRGGKWNLVGEPFPRATSGAFRGDLTSFGGELIFGGSFESEPGEPEIPMYRWDGVMWSPLLTAPEILSSLGSLAVVDGELYAGGAIVGISFRPRIAILRWDGVQWHRLQGDFGIGTGNLSGSGLHLSALFAHGDSLIAAGQFSRIGDVVSQNLARWACVPCYPDCDQSTGVGILDVFDFLCFQNSFVNNEAYACDCDTSTGSGFCDIFDFLCFQDAFVSGCP